MITDDSSKNISLELINSSEINIDKLEKDVFKKFNLEDLLEKSKTIPFYSKNLHYYNCVIDTVNEIVHFNETEMKFILKWAGSMFKNLHGCGPDSTYFINAKEGLDDLNKYLSLRPTMNNYKLSLLDVIVISAIRQNCLVFEELEKINFEEFENIKRLADWIEGITEVSWNRIIKISRNKVSTK